MKHLLCLILLLSAVPAFAAPVAAPVATPAPVPAPMATPEPKPIPRLQTLLADKNLRLSFTGLGPECQLLRIALLRKDPLLPGYGSFNRPVRVDQTHGRMVTLVLGPEFQPHRYGAGDLRLSCYDAGGQRLQTLLNQAPLALEQAEISLDVSTAFGPGDPDGKKH